MLNLVFIHSAGADHRMWHGQREFFAGSHAVLDIDLRRRSQRTDETPADSYVSDAREVLRRMDAARMPRAVLIGHAAGGGVAMTVALNAPERVGALVLVATAGRPPTLATVPEVARPRSRGRAVADSIRAPTLVIGGHDHRETTLQPAEALPDCGPQPQVEQAAAFTFNLQMFLGRLARAERD